MRKLNKTRPTGLRLIFIKWWFLTNDRGLLLFSNGMGCDGCLLRSSVITARGSSELGRAAKVATFIRKNSEIGAIVIIYIRI